MRMSHGPFHHHITDSSEEKQCEDLGAASVQKNRTAAQRTSTTPAT